MRRSLEFVEFTLGEFRSIRPLDHPEDQKGSKEYLLQIKRHKTMQYVSADIVLTEIEAKAFKTYVLCARPTIVDCNSNFCIIFVSSTGRTARECCVKLPVSNVTKILRNSGLAAGVSVGSVNSRMLRRSTISGAWKKNTDADFRQKLSDLAGHRIDTARRHYAVYDTGEASQRAKKLQQYRDSEAHKEADSDDADQTADGASVHEAEAEARESEAELPEQGPTSPTPATVISPLSRLVSYHHVFVVGKKWD